MIFLIYNLLLFILSYTILSFLNYPQKKKELFLVVQMTVQLLYVHIMKDYTTLPDLSEYVIGYNYMKTLDIDRVYQLQWYHKFEVGWCYLNYFLTRICDHYIAIFIVTSSIIVCGYSLLSWKYSPNPLFSLFIFFFLVYGQSLFVLRQHVAMALCFLTIPFILERKAKFFFGLVFIAFLIHKTAVIFTIIYFLYSFKLNKKFLFIMFLGGIALGLFFNLFIAVMSLYITGFEGYISNDNAEGANWVMPLIQCCVMGLFCISSLKINLLEGIDKLLFQILLLAIILGFSSIGFNSIIGRLNMYFTSVIFLTIPNFLNYCHGNYKSALNIVVFISFMLLFFRSTEYIKGIQLITLF